MLAAKTPEDSPAWLLSLVAAACLVLVWVRYTLPISDTLDWPIQVLSSARVQREIPYVDIHVLYGPLGHYMLATFLSASGLGLDLGARTFHGINAIVTLALSAAMAAALSGHRQRTRALLTMLLLVGPVAALGWYSGLAVNLTLLGVLLVQRSTSPRNDAATVYAAGVAVVVVLLTLVRVNFGAYFALGSLVALSLRAYRTGSWRPIATYLATGCLLSAATATFLHWRGILVPYVEATFLYISRFGTRTIPPAVLWENIQSIRSAGALYSFAGLMGVGSPAALAVLIPLSLWLAFRRWQQPSSLLLGLLIAAFTSYMLPRFDPKHYLVMTAFAAIVVVGSDEEHHVRRGARLAAIGLITFLSALQLAGIASYIYRYGPNGRPDGARAGYLFNPETLSLIADLRARMLPADELLVASWPGSCECTLHMCANMAVYSAIDRLPQGRMWISDTAVSSFGDAQTEMIEHLRLAGTKYVAFEATPDAPCGKRTIEDPGLLAEWVKHHYTRVAAIEPAGAKSHWYLYERGP